MTTIAWDGERLAADRMSADEDGIACPARKIWIKRLNGRACIAAVSGSLHSGLEMLKWLADGGQAADYPDVGGGYLILITPQQILEYSFGYAVPMEYPLEQKMAWGSGRSLGLGAMAAGADAVRAVEIACEYDTGSGYGAESHALADLGA